MKSEGGDYLGPVWGWDKGMRKQGIKEGVSIDA